MAPITLNPRGVASDPLVVEGNQWDDGVILDIYGRSNNFLLQDDALVPFACPGLFDRRILGAQTYRLTGGNEGLKGASDWVRTARESRDEPECLAFGFYQWLAAGRYGAGFGVDCSDCAANAPVTLDVTADRGRLTLARQAISGTRSNEEITLEFSVFRPVEVESRVHYGGSGVVTVRYIRLFQLPAGSGS